MDALFMKESLLKFIQGKSSSKLIYYIIIFYMENTGETKIPFVTACGPVTIKMRL